jgi:hypothetical protein
MGNPEYVFYVLGAHSLLAIVALHLFTKLTGELKEREE